MAHEVESMFSVYKPPWHGLGKVLDYIPNIREGIAASGLDWTVEKRRIQYLDFKEESYRKANDTYAVVRSDNNACLGIVGKQWTPLQNVEAFEFFDPFIENGFATYETAGSLKEGKRVWVLAKINSLKGDVIPGDTVECYLLLSNGHDGKTGVNVMFSPIRVVCWNTLGRAEGTNADIWHRITMRHTQSLKASLDVVQNAVDLTKRTFELTMEQFQFLASRQVKDLDKYLINVVKPKLSQTFDDLSEKEKVEALPRAHPDIVSLFTDGPGTENPKMRGTFWSAYNAITHWVDHNRGGSAENRLNSAWFNEGRVIKERAFKEAMKLAA